MKKIFFRWVSLIIFSCFAVSISCADDKSPDLVEATQQLQSIFPKMRVDSVQNSPIEGVLEVVSGDRIIYFAPASGHVLAGDLYSKNKKNLTKDRMAEIMSARIAKLPLDQGLKIGNGPNTVIEVTDPDCSYCRKGSKFFLNRKDVTRYVFLMPLKMHPQARTKSQYILSAKDPQTAYEEVFTGKFDEAPLPPFKDNGWLDRQSKAIEPLGVNSTPTYWVNGKYISGSNLRVISDLLKPPAEKPPKPEVAKPEAEKAEE
jgi:thiol:disulfide interchange protein DsbC